MTSVDLTSDDTKLQDVEDVICSKQQLSEIPFRRLLKSTPLTHQVELMHTSHATDGTHTPNNETKNDCTGGFVSPLILTC